MTLTRAQSTLLRDLSLGHAAVLARLLSDTGPMEGALDPVVAGLVRIATLIALGADTPAYQREVNATMGAGASADQVIDVLARVAPIVGSTHAMSAAPRLALALGYDVDAALESLEVDDR
jgi:4-carboxymuconolactone decarboxylase